MSIKKKKKAKSLSVAVPLDFSGTKCMICQAALDNGSDLFLHISNRHCACAICIRFFPTIGPLNDHYVNEHGFKTKDTADNVEVVVKPETGSGDNLFSAAPPKVEEDIFAPNFPSEDVNLNAEVKDEQDDGGDMFGDDAFDYFGDSLMDDDNDIGANDNDIVNGNYANDTVDDNDANANDNDANESVNDNDASVDIKTEINVSWDKEEEKKEDKCLCVQCGRDILAQKCTARQLQSCQLSDNDNNRYCLKCDKLFGVNGILDTHVEAVLLERCQVVVPEAVSKSEQVGQKKYKCEKCPKSYPKRDRLNRHVGSVHDETRFECDACGKSFPEKYSLKRHVKRQTCAHPPEPEPCQTCQTCGRQFQRLRHLKIHQRSCQNIVKDQSLVVDRLALEQVLIDKGNLTCPKCEEEFSSVVLYQLHIGNCQRITTACPQCGKVFDKRLCDSYFKNHLQGRCPKRQRRRRNDRPPAPQGRVHEKTKKRQGWQKKTKRFRCKLCGDMRGNRKALVGHVRIHHPEVEDSRMDEIIEREFNPNNGDGTAGITKWKREDQKCTCPHCPLTFTSFSKRRHHMEDCHEKTAICPFCGKAYFFQFSLKTHIRKKHGDAEGVEGNNVHMCDKCHKQFTTSGGLKIHIKSEHENIRYQCNWCGQRSKYSSNFKYHVDAFHPEKSHLPLGTMYKKVVLNDTDIDDNELASKNYVCFACDMEFPTIWERRMHMAATHEKNFKCDFCNATFFNEDMKKSHVKRDHSVGNENNGRNMTDNGTFLKPCPKCGMTFNTRHDRADHMSKNHTPEFQCDKCSKSFFFQRTLDVHIKKKHNPAATENAEDNHGRTLIPCPKCGMTFRKQRERSRHMKELHEPDFQCDKCPMAFFFRISLVRHVENKHNATFVKKSDRKGRSLSPCPVCQVPFESQKQRSSHMNESHTPDLQCQLCEKAFFFKTSLNAHLKLKHNE